MAAELVIVPPSGGTNVSVAPVLKLLPLMVSVWMPFNGGSADGDTLLMDGAGVATVVDGGVVTVGEAVCVAAVEEVETATAFNPTSPTQPLGADDQLMLYHVKVFPLPSAWACAGPPTTVPWTPDA